MPGRPGGGAAARRRAADEAGPARHRPPAAAAAKPGAARTITWEALVPADWDPFKDFKDLNFQMLDDGDPRAN